MAIAAIAKQKTQVSALPTLVCFSRMLSPPSSLFATSHTVLDKHPSSLLPYSSLQNLASTETIHEHFVIFNPSNNARMQALRTMPVQNPYARITTKY